MAFAFKRRRRVNTTISAKILLQANASIPANIAVLIVQSSSETVCMYGNMAESIALCKSSNFTLKQTCKHSKSDVISRTCQNFQGFLILLF